MHLDQENKQVKANVEYIFVNPEGNRDMAMRYNRVVR